MRVVIVLCGWLWRWWVGGEQWWQAWEHSGNNGWLKCVKARVGGHGQIGFYKTYDGPNSTMVD
jgi:hypothetical protein